MNKTPIQSRPRSYGKSVFAISQFIASCKAGEASKYEGLDFVCLSKKAYAKELALSEQRGKRKEKKEIISKIKKLKYKSAEHLDLTASDIYMHNITIDEIIEALKKGNQTLDK